MPEDRDLTVQKILDQEEAPAISVDPQGDVTSVNERFTSDYGWTAAELVGKPLTTIIPPALRESHLVGFSRFLVTEKPTLLGRPLRLPILCRDGSERSAEHTILAEKRGKTWRLAALIRP